MDARAALLLALFLLLTTAAASPGALSEWFHGALRFKDGEGYLVVENSPSLNPEDELTILTWINGSAVPNPAQYLSHFDTFNASDYLDWARSENVTLDNGLLQLARLKVRTSEEEGLVLWLHFDEGNGTVAHDSSGYENDGSLKGGNTPPQWVNGKFGKALEFDGIDDYVEILGGTSLNFNGKLEVTVTAWVYRKGDSGGCCGQIVGQRDVNGFDLRYDNRDTGAELEFIVYNGNWVGDGTNFGIPLPLNEWHFIAGVSNGTHLLLYDNGELKDTIGFSGTIQSSGTQTKVGGASDGYFNGIIDEVHIYDRALSEEEIRMQYLQAALHLWNGTDNYWENGKGALELNASQLRNQAGFSCVGDQCNLTIFLDNDAFRSSEQQLVIYGLENVSIYYNASDGSWRSAKELDAIGQGKVEIQPGYVTDGLVAYWSFDEGSGNVAVDHSGNNNGTIYGAQWVDGRFGKALEFDGVDDYVKGPNTDVLSFTGDFSVSVWVKPFSTGTDCGWSRDNPIVWKVGHEGSNDDNYGVGFACNRFTFQIERASDDADFPRSSLSTYELNKWYHVVAVREQPYMKIYVNGKEDGTWDVGNWAPYTGPEGIYIGRTDPSHGYSGYFSGIIDEVRIYNRALSAEEIKINYYAQLPKYKTIVNYTLAGGDGWDYGIRDIMSGGSYWLDEQGEEHGLIGIANDFIKLYSVQFYDDFGDGDYGGWSVDSGTWTVEDGELSIEASGTTYYLDNYVNLSYVLISFDAKFIEGYGGDEAIRFYIFDKSTGDGIFDGFYTKESTYCPNGGYIGERVGGDWKYTQRCNVKTIDYGVWYNFKILIEPRRIKLYVDDVLYLDFDRTVHQSYPGIYPNIRIGATKAHVHFDNIKIYGVSVSYTHLTLPRRLRCRSRWSPYH